MKRFIKPLIILICLVIAIYAMYGCVIELFDLDGFENKSQVINVIKDNIDDLNRLTQEIYYKFYKNDCSFVIVENKFIKKWHSSFNYKTNESNKIFKDCKLNYIVINYDEKRIKFSVKCKFGTDCGFYYSFTDNSYYNKTKNRSDVMYAQYDNWNIELVYRSGWYTEKIFNNWYFYENDFDNLYFLNYLKEDIIHMDIYDEVCKRFKKYFN